jgi:hypothetical protein
MDRIDRRLNLGDQAKKITYEELSFLPSGKDARLSHCLKYASLCVSIVKGFTTTYILLEA